MKTAVILFACISIALSAPQRRVFLDGFLDTTHLKDTVQQLANSLGSDSSEGLCEKECHSLLSDPSNILHHSCPLICHGLQDLIHRFNIVPHTTPSA